METLTVIPIQAEFEFFLQGCSEQGWQAEMDKIGKLPVARLPKLGLILAQGGLGKTQFAVQTQHLLEAIPQLNLVICAGAAGALQDNLAVGDVVVATETIEHDIRNHFGKRLLPKFSGAEAVVAAFKQLTVKTAFRLHFGAVASGDEDVVSTERRQELNALTGALAVAWEGAGGARACRFSGVPFIEVRGVSDSADQSAAADFVQNLPQVMRNVAQVVTAWASHYQSV